MSKQALAGVPARARGAQRLVICEQVFDYQLGQDFIAVLHPVSKLSFVVPTPATLGLEIKRAIWNRYQELLKAAAPTQPVLTDTLGKEGTSGENTSITF